MDGAKLALIGAGVAMAAGGAYLAFHREPTLSEEIVDAVGAPFRFASMLPWILGGAVVVAGIVALNNPHLVVGAIGRG